MKIIQITSRNEASALREAVAILRSGGIIAHPTDTVWGLAADWSNPKAVKKIHQSKGSEASKNLLINLPSKAWLSKLGSKLCKAHKLAKAFWPGGLALLILTKDGKGKLGVRFPKHHLSNQLAKAFGKPLITTSANLRGETPATSAMEIAEIFAQRKVKPDLILADNSKPAKLPSTIVDVSGSEAQLIRSGVISFTRVLQMLKRQ
ncbi:MAG: L-threonylcarbamoyladenylate synthase [Candidatus Gracilibacteria bacterium]|nr:L-threonylcarbamoyladenylate synthase [Candidatus Gracilibacteria bacterium]MDD5178749.1 L-threonylcarbamoyladenylate synthase [Candidatus Gracilibacteria bacterium]